MRFDETRKASEYLLVTYRLQSKFGPKARWEEEMQEFGLSRETNSQVGAFDQQTTDSK